LKEAYKNDLFFASDISSFLSQKRVHAVCCISGFGEETSGDLSMRLLNKQQKSAKIFT
jgi:hypothetical protein